MADRFDPVAHAAHARQLSELATKARATLQERRIEHGTRLGVERDQAARAASMAEQEQATIKMQVKRELGVADKADRAAAELETKAARLAPGEAMAEELREQAAEQRGFAEIARRRAHAAEDAANRLEETIYQNKQNVEALEAQMKANKEFDPIEFEIDGLEWHVRTARDIAESAQRLHDLQPQIDQALARGETALAKKLNDEANLHRMAIDGVGKVLTESPADAAVLKRIGIDAPASMFQVPGFDPPAPATPPAPTSLDDGAPATSDEVATAEPPPGEPLALVDPADVEAPATDAAPATDDPTTAIDDPTTAIEPTPDVVATATDDVVTGNVVEPTTEPATEPAIESPPVVEETVVGADITLAAQEEPVPATEVAPAPAFDESSLADVSFPEPVEPSFDMGMDEVAAVTSDVSEADFADVV